MYPVRRNGAFGAVALARELDDPATLSFSLLALAATAGDRELLSQARLLRAVALVELGDRGGLADLEEYCRLAGRLEEARDLAEAARQLGRRIGQPDADSVADAQLWELGRFDGRRSAAGTDPRPASGDWPAWRAILLAEAGDLEAARAAFAGFDPDRYVLRPGVVRSHDPWPLLVTAEAAALAGDGRQRAASYQALRPLAGSHTVLGGFVAYTGAADHYLGVLAAALGRPGRPPPPCGRRSSCTSGPAPPPGPPSAASTCGGWRSRPPRRPTSFAVRVSCGP